MRATVLRGGRLEVRETADPTPGPGQLLVRTRSTAICASDVHFMDHPEAVAGDPKFLYDPDQDIILGHEFVAEVVDHGPGCTDQLPVGARVTSIPVLLQGDNILVIGQHPAAPGSFGEYFLLTEGLARAVPDGVPDDAVALVDAFAVGEFYVRCAAMAPGELPVVLGAGAIGLSAVAALRSRGIEQIIVSDPSAQRRRLAADFGADHLVDPSQISPFEEWRRLAQQSGTTSPPVVFECVGVPGLLQSIIDDCPFRTRIFAAGGHYTSDAIQVTPATQKGVSIQFAGGPDFEDWYGTLDAVVGGRLDPRPCIGSIVGLTDVPEAIDQARRSSGPVRIIVHPRD